ncbi:MAG: succinyl-CoA synthetase (ADP-forming) beta subunit [Methanomicrobia archaeon]|nr:succinyl-CoA synthetase (ADP-forming) beta subunit [Methanomicrobia archaeon]
MRLLECEAKEIYARYGIPVPKGVRVKAGEKIPDLSGIGPELVVKAQVEVGGRGKAGGIVMAAPADAARVADELFRKEIRGVPVREILIEERLPIRHEHYLSILVDRSTRQPVVLFAEAGGVDIEQAAKETPEAVQRVTVSPLLTDIPPFALRDLLGARVKEFGPVVNRLWKVFREKDAMLAEVNPLVTTERGVFAADAKLIVDDNALARQGIAVNRDLSPREREAESHGFSYVELDGSVGVIGNGAGLTMATLDLIQFYGGAAANFLDVGGGADQERVKHAVRLVAGRPGVKVILVNLLGGITRCDDVARGILDAGVPQTVMVRLAGTNEAEGKKILDGRGYPMYVTIDEAVKAAVEAAR